MQTFSTPATLSDAIATLKANGKTLAFVPTMGALHKGHLALVEHAKMLADEVIVSIFVNPTQFAEGEDLEVYPRTEEADCALLEQAGVYGVYLPTIEGMYPDGVKKADVTLENADVLEGACREGFFYGVATVVNILFDHVQPNIAVFGEKDFQQLCMIHQIAKQRGDDIEIVGVETVREIDGLAFSSRNRYLKARQRAIAPLLHHVLCEVREVLGSEGVEEKELVLEVAKEKLREAGFSKVDYVELVDALTCGAPRKGQPMRLVAAAFLESTRLIDNIAM